MSVSLFYKLIVIDVSLVSSLLGVPFITVKGALEVYDCGATSRYTNSHDASVMNHSNI